MAKPVTGQTTFGANTTGTTVQLDNNFLLAYNALNDLNTYSNYIVDTGAANGYVAPLPSNITASLAAGLAVQFLATNANTGPSTLNVGGTGVKNILNTDGSTLSAGQIPANGIISVMYDGTQYLMTGAVPGTGFFKSSVFTRDTTVASGTQAITLVGFRPKLVEINAVINGTKFMSWGSIDASVSQCIFDDSVDAANTYALSATFGIVSQQSAGGTDKYEGAFSAFGADGFTISWTKTGSPTGIIMGQYRAFR